MFDYRSVFLYYSKGNTVSQIATICECSRTTVYRALERAKRINLPMPVPTSISDEQLLAMLYPKRGRNQDYDLPDFRAISRDKIKRKLSMRVAWRRYYKRTIKAGKKPYMFTRFCALFYRCFHELKAKVKDKVIMTYRFYRMEIKANRNYPITQMEWIDRKDRWLKELRLEESKL